MMITNRMEPKMPDPTSVIISITIAAVITLESTVLLRGQVDSIFRTMQQMYSISSTLARHQGNERKRQSYPAFMFSSGNSPSTTMMHEGGKISFVLPCT